MAQSIRTRLLRMPKREQEIHVITHQPDPNESSISTPLMSPSNSKGSPKQLSSSRQRLVEPDYVPPPTAKFLRPNSPWLTVRRNLHRIRHMGYGEDNAMQNLYLGLQMKRELKRAQEEIKNIDKQENFHPVKQFTLAIDGKSGKKYNTSHVKPDDALIYDRLGEEPLALQNLLYYFSKQEVPPGTVFWEFLNEVNHVLNMKRKRTVRIQRLRRLALTLAVVFYSIIGFMLFLLIISVITTATKMNDPEVQWLAPSVNKGSSNILL
ncbi:unnamed protein product [Rotaria sordida]|uniref:Uncharacterized protein n=1 Tax=Rotaria sordida TaxID=392033 RepID=A0A813W135_9BILA|nr:unnamed protein product [Rotaria sordida]